MENIYSTANTVTQCEPYLYLWEDRGEWVEEHNCYKKYLGIHNGRYGYRYTGSGSNFLPAFEERPDDFHRTIIMHDWDYSFVYSQEEAILKAVGASANTAWYNIQEVSWPIIPSEETRRRCSDAQRGKVVSADTRKKISEANGRRTSEEKARISAKISFAAKNISDETRAKMSAAKKGKPSPNKGRTMSQEQKNKLSAVNKGKVHSETFREKMRIAATAGWEKRRRNKEENDSCQG